MTAPPSPLDALAAYGVTLDDEPESSDGRPWPDPPTDEAYAGLFGEIVRLIEPRSEADPVALLGTALVAFGSAIGSRPHALVGADRHGSNLFLALVGRSAKARKGASWSPVRRLFETADPDWTYNRIVSGLGSGEGLVFAVRDPLTKTGKDGEIDVIDPGEPDKRALVLAPEFASVLRVMARQGSTLSAVLRDAWDRGDLRVTTKNMPLRATGAHVSIVAHVTEDELRRELADTEQTNGFANRFAWLAVRRSKFLPDPEPLEGDDVDALARQLGSSLAWASVRGEIRRDEIARGMWRDGYAHLSRDRFGLVGAMTDRAEPIVLRLALLYALADRSAVVGESHLRSALAVWSYCERSAEYLFGQSTGDPIADRLEQAILSSGRLDRTGMRDLFARHVNGRRIDEALATLASAGRIRRVPSVVNGGRPAEVWEPAA